MNYIYDKERILEIIKKDYEERYDLKLEGSEIEIEINLKEDGSIEFISDKEELNRYVEGSENPPFMSTSIQEDVLELINWAIRNKKFLITLYEKKSPFEPTKNIGYVFMPISVEGQFVSIELFAEIEVWSNSMSYTDFDSRERVLLMTRMQKIKVADLSNFKKEGENEYV